MNKQKQEDIYTSLSKNYKFKRLENGAKFRSYDDAFNAVLELMNNFNIAAAQNNKMVYFADKLQERPYTEAVEDEAVTTYDGVVMSFSMYLDWVLNLKVEKIIDRNKTLIKGDSDLLYDEFVNRYSDSFSIVDVVKKKNGLLIKKI